MNSYFLCVTQPSNAGDLLINRMLVEELSQYGTVYVDCYNCPSTFKSILVGGADNIVDIYNTYGWSLKKGAFYSFTRFLKKKNITLYTQSPGPLNKMSSLLLKFSYSIIRAILAKSRVSFIRIGNCCSAAIVTKTNILESHNVEYYVRSKNAVSFLRQFRENGIHYIPDLAYLYRNHAVISEKKKIALMSFRKVTESLDEFVAWVKGCVNQLVVSGYEVVFYYQVKSDADFMKYLHDIIGSKSIILKTDQLWYDNFDFYSDKSLVISNRLHCLLMGAVYNAVPLAYVDGEKHVRKIQDVFESSFGGNSATYLTNFTESTKLSNIIENLSVYQKNIDEIVDNNNEVCRNTVNHIYQQIAGKD